MVWEILLEMDFFFEKTAWHEKNSRSDSLGLEFGKSF